MQYNQELIQALKIALFAGKHEDCLDIEQVELIKQHIELLSQGQFGIISQIQIIDDKEV
jgi:hypothetical protein